MSKEEISRQIVAYHVKAAELHRDNFELAWRYRQAAVRLGWTLSQRWRPDAP